MPNKINPKDREYVEKLSENLEGVSFTGSEELDTAVGDLNNEEKSKSKECKIMKKIRRLFGLHEKTSEEKK